MAAVDILIPTCNRMAGLAVTLTSLIGQTWQDFRVVISDQTEDEDVESSPVVLAPVRVLRFHGHTVDIHKHLPRRGLAEQRQFLLDQASAPYSLFIDDDLILETDAVEQMLRAIQEENCGFVGYAVPGLSYINDVRPQHHAVEFWDGPVQPEQIRPDTPEWDRVALHSAANILHVAERLGITPDNPRRYKVSWIGACAMFDTAKLREVGGFDFWEQLPAEHCGEDVLAQNRVLERYGACGIIPTRVYHQELPTTVPNREVDAPRVFL
jgi:GT2 family glycosyltransferase